MGIRVNRFYLTKSLGSTLFGLCTERNIDLRNLSFIIDGLTKRQNSSRQRRLIDIGPVSIRDNRVLNGPLGRSLRSFARTAHSAHSLRSAPLRYACFAMLASLARSVHGLAHSLRSLPRGTVEIHESKLSHEGVSEVGERARK